ncbi:hypothetical protein NPIL_244431 [Nephila pilipes]|uniref:Uncharacterized protein n=1 Tax=Nephila pilipes TaxID=299642 RepID=A0A8X6I8D6_NEPPI|nr:hypothetical protein NPIL_244431 [Nephila pilipes]
MERDNQFGFKKIEEGVGESEKNTDALKKYRLRKNVIFSTPFAFPLNLLKIITSSFKGNNRLVEFCSRSTETEIACHLIFVTECSIPKAVPAEGYLWLQKR